MPTVAIGTADVSYSVRPGSLPPVVLVHGTAGTAATNFAHLADAWGDRTVVALDLSGSGETRDAGGPIELDELVDQVAGVAVAAGVDGERYHVVGFSLGAVVATAVAARFPSQVRSLTAIAGWASSDNPRTQVQFDLWQRLVEHHPDLAAPFLVLTGFSPPFLSGLKPAEMEVLVTTTRNSLPPGTVRQAELDTRIEITHLAPEVSVPALVIGLTRDHMVPVEEARQLHRLVPGARYVEIDSGHLVLFEDPTSLMTAITTFLADTDQLT